MKKLLLTTVSALLATTSMASTAPAATGKQLFGYWSNWDTYGRAYQPIDIPMSDLTAVLYSFAQVGSCAAPYYATDSDPTLCNAGKANSGLTGMQDYQLHSADPYSDFTSAVTGGGLGNMSKVINDAHAAKASALLSVGGYTLSVPLTTAMDASHQATFITSIVSFLNKVKQDNKGDGFDGVDIDWEPIGPTGKPWAFLSGAGASTVLNNYVSFLANLKTALQKNYANYAWLTIAAPADPSIVSAANKVYAKAYPGQNFWDLVQHAVNYMNVMAYDYHGAFDSPMITNFNAPLSEDPNQPAGSDSMNVTSTISAYTVAGVWANKLIMGMPAYGRALAGVPAGASTTTPGMYQTFTGPYKGEWAATGVYDYKDIVGKLLGNGWTDYRNTAAGETAAYCASCTTASDLSVGSGGAWISYDNINDAQAIATCVDQKGLAGMMVWELSGDLPATDPGSLVVTAKNTMASYLKEK